MTGYHVEFTQLTKVRVRDENGDDHYFNCTDYEVDDGFLVARNGDVIVVIFNADRWAFVCVGIEA